MKKRPLVDVKAHLSEVVDLAEQRGERILILRHGKPAAAIVPVSDVLPVRKAPVRRLARREVAAIFARLGRSSEGVSAVDELLRNRR